MRVYFPAKQMLFCLLSFKYFATRGKNVYEQLTVSCVGSFLFNVLWYDLMNKQIRLLSYVRTIEHSLFLN